MNVPSDASGPLPWPRWAYVPGETDGVDADYETLDLAKALVPPAFRGYVPARHPALRYGLALNDRGISGNRRRCWKRSGPQPRKAAASAFFYAPAFTSPMPICDCACSGCIRPRACSATRRQSYGR